MVAAVDWGEVTALGTAALALGVPIASWGVFLAYRASTQDITATREAMYAAHDDAEQQLEAAEQPLLIEVLRHGPVTDDMEAVPNPDARQRAALPMMVSAHLGLAPRSIDPRAAYVVVENGVAYLSVPLRNVGRGLAVIEPIGITVDDVALRTVQVDRPRVPPGESSRVSCSVQAPDAATNYTLSVAYSSVAGRQAKLAEIKLEPTSAPECRVVTINNRIAIHDWERIGQAERRRDVLAGN
jgi:hypothetical protein